MIDYQRTVEFLRDYRAVPGQAVTDEVRHHAADYAQLCSEANERLRQCSSLLQTGLRSEAIQLANDTPNLLELVAALDLPDATAWGEFCLHNDLPVAPPLQMDRASQLNEAYGQEEPLEGLLNRHRRLALSHAPIKERLETMRQIHAIDAGSSFWERDIREFEVARMRELRLAFAAALEHHDGQAITALSAEVLQSPWLEPVGQDLLAAAQGAEDRVRLLAVNTNLRALHHKLREAYAVKDHAACKSLVQEIRKLLADANQGLRPDTAAEMNAVIAWIAQEDELAARHQSITKSQKQLADALDAGVPAAKIEPLYQRLRDLGEPIPPELEQRRQQILEREARSAQRRSRLVLGGVAAGVVVLLAGGYLYFRSDLASGWARKIQEANAARNVSLAQQLIQEQERRAPEFSLSPRIVEAKQQTEILRKQYDEDHRLAQKLIAALESQQQQAAKDVAGAQEMQARELLAAAARAEQQFPQPQVIKRLAWVDPDNKLSGTISALQQAAQQLREAADRKAQAAAQALSQRLDSITPEAAAGQRAMAAMDAIATEINGLSALSGLGKDASEAIAAANTKYDQKRTLLSKGRDEAQQLVAMRRRATSTDAWRKELEAFVAHYPDSPTSRDLARAIEMLGGSAAIEAMRAMEESWAGQFASTGETMARTRLDELKAYTTANPRSPYLPAINQYTAYLTQSADALAVKSTWLGGFRELLTTPMMAELNYMAASDGTRYYVLGDIKLKTLRLNDRVSVTFEAIDPANLAKRKTVTISPPVTLIAEKPVPAPQQKFVQNLGVQLKQIDAANWDTFGISVIDQLARDKEMDIVVRCMLLQQALETTVQVSGWGLGGVYDQALRDLKRAEVENIVWYDPAKPIPQATTEALQHIIDGLPKADVAMQTLRDNRAKMFRAMNAVYATTGTLLRDETGRRAVYACTSVDDGSVVWAAGPLPKAADQPAPMLRVARYTGGKCVLDDAVLRDLPDGTMLFIGK